MTIATRLPLPPATQMQNSCVAVGVPFGNWSADINCPNCQHELRVTIGPAKAHTAHWCTPPRWCGALPITPQCSVQPTHLPHSPLYDPLSSVLNQQCSDELRRLTDTLRALRLSGWYYGNLDWQAARKLLKDASLGAFVIRDSGDRNFIFSLSVQTERGPTSVRLHFENGYFRLDCDQPLARYMPRFKCVVDMIQHYTRLGHRGGAGTVWVDKEGCPHSPVLLNTPLRKSPPSLLHSARLAIHKALDSNPLTPKIQCAPKHRHLPLPTILIDYLGEYPYSI